MKDLSTSVYLSPIIIKLSFRSRLQSHIIIHLDSALLVMQLGPPQDHVVNLDGHTTSDQIWLAQHVGHWSLHPPTSLPLLRLSSSTRAMTALAAELNWEVNPKTATTNNGRSAHDNGKNRVSHHQQTWKHAPSRLGLQRDRLHNNSPSLRRHARSDYSPHSCAKAGVADTSPSGWEGFARSPT